MVVIIPFTFLIFIVLFRLMLLVLVIGVFWVSISVGNYLMLARFVLLIGLIVFKGF